MSKALLAQLLLPAAQNLENQANARIAAAQGGTDTGQTIAQRLISDLGSNSQTSSGQTGVPAPFGVQARSLGAPLTSVTNITKPLNVPLGNAAPTITNTPAGPKVIYEPKAGPDYSNLHNPLIDSWGKSGILQNPNGFTHYESSDKSLPFIGPNYNKMGAQSGYWYDPYTDKYYENSNTLKGLMKSQGAAPKQPSLLDQLLPALGSAIVQGGGSALGKSAANGVSSLFSSLFNSIGGAEGSRTLSSDALLSNGDILNYNNYADSLSSGGSGATDWASMLGDDSGTLPSGQFDNIENILGQKLGANQGTMDVANLATDYASGNYPMLAIHAFQDAPTLFHDAVNEGGNIVDKIGSGLSKVGSFFGF